MPAKYTEEEFEDNFWSRVDMTSDASGCWLWTGSKSRYGRVSYGRVSWQGKYVYTHIVAWLLTGNTDKGELDLSHSENCKGKKHCCNPEHLTPKTRSENQLDRHRDGSMTQAKLNEQQVREIRRMLAEGKQQKEIAKEFGVRQTQISRIHTGEAWSHLA